MDRIAMISGDEYDALTKIGRKYNLFRAGDRAKIKRGYRRRLRRQMKDQQLMNGNLEGK